MPEFRVAVDDETADALQTETDLLGFRDSENYLAWIVDNRAAIEQGTESAELLESYRDRLVALEERLAAEGVDPAAVDADSDPISNATPADAASASGGSSRRTDASSSRGATADHSTASSGGTADGGTAGSGASPRSAKDTDGAASTERAASTLSQTSKSRSNVDTIQTSADRGSSVDTGGTASDASAGGSPGSAAEESTADEPRAASDGGVSTESEITSMHLQPERVQRVREDPVTEDAGSLKTVETDRLDEMSRRAVAETRKQLDREVETGLDYSSATTLDDSDVRPGEDLADLDRIDVPGRTQGLVDARRVVVGRALAYLHDEGRARKQDFVDELYEDWPAGYESAAGWWRCVRESLKQVDAVNSGQVWTYEK
ncbi:hypothetical protein GCM10028857_10970 [Salinarchaeum chitinilyticum]